MNDLTLVNEKWPTLSKQERRNTIQQLEDQCKALDSAVHVDIELSHFHCDGVYAREMLIPKGTTLVGEIHRHPHINVVSQGKIRVATDQGIKTISAPSTFISPAGTKRAGFVLEDTIWTVFHATKETNIDKIREEFIAPNYSSLDKQLGESNGMGSSCSSSSYDSSISNRSEESSKES